MPNDPYSPECVEEEFSEVHLARVFCSADMPLSNQRLYPNPNHTRL
jgi:hypothetical protein